MHLTGVIFFALGISPVVNSSLSGQCLVFGVLVFWCLVFGVLVFRVYCFCVLRFVFGICTSTARSSAMRQSVQTQNLGLRMEGVHLCSEELSDAGTLGIHWAVLVDLLTLRLGKDTRR